MERDKLRVDPFLYQKRVYFCNYKVELHSYKTGVHPKELLISIVRNTTIWTRI
jgi:hypothetical protein